MTAVPETTNESMAADLLGGVFAEIANTREFQKRIKAVERYLVRTRGLSVERAEALMNDALESALRSVGA